MGERGGGLRLAEEIARLSTRQRVFLEQQLAKRRAARGEDRIPRQPEQEAFPLSPSQQRLWLVDQLEGGSPFYNLAAALSLHGPLAIPALAGALAEVVRRQEALRTVFPGDEPMQVIRPFLPPALPVLDLSALPRAAADLETRRLTRGEAVRPFSLARGPLLRCRLLRLSEREHAFLCVLHHIVADWWSLAVLVREIVALYGAAVAGRPSPLPPLPIQYRDFAVWQRRRLDGERLATELACWRRQLAGAPPHLDLATDFPRPAVQSYRGRRLEIELPEELAAGLAALGRAEGATLFAVLLAAYQILLHHGSGAEDIVVSAPVSGRERQETHGLIGFCATTLLFRTDLSGNPSFRSLLARVRQVVLDAYAHSQVALDRIIEDLAPERSLDRTPFFQAGLNFIEQDPLAESAGAGLTLSPLEIDSGIVQHEINLIFVRMPRGLTAKIEYRSDLFDPRTAAVWGEQLERLLGHLVSSPGAHLQSLDELLRSTGERRREEEKRQLDRISFQRLRERRRPAPLAAAQGGR